MGSRWCLARLHGLSCIANVLANVTRWLCGNSWLLTIIASLHSCIATLLSNLTISFAYVTQLQSVVTELQPDVSKLQPDIARRNAVQSIVAKVQSNLTELQPDKSSSASIPDQSKVQPDKSRWLQSDQSSCLQPYKSIRSVFSNKSSHGFPTLARAQIFAHVAKVMEA